MLTMIDVSNLVWVTRFGQLKSKEKESHAKELILQETLKAIFGIYKKYKSNGLLLAFDSPNVWRKEKYSLYKALRETEYDLYYDEVREVMGDLETFFKEHTNCYAMKVERCEADDIIAAVCKILPETPKVIASTDKDFVQLIDGSTFLYNITKKEERKSDDPEYDLFLKCIRGDRGDNILSAFPRVRETRLKECWEDPYLMQNLMNEKRKDGKIVGEEFEFNRDLIDFDRIPDEVIQAVVDELQAIQEEIFENDKYSQVGIIKALAELGIKSYAKEIGTDTRILKTRFKILEL